MYSGTRLNTFDNGKDKTKKNCHRDLVIFPFSFYTAALLHLFQCVLNNCQLVHNGAISARYEYQLPLLYRFRFGHS